MIVTTAREYRDIASAKLQTPYARADALMPRVDGVGPLQMYWFDRDPLRHAAALLMRWPLREQPMVLDCGCGAGSMAALLHRVRPDIQWILLGHSLTQLVHAPSSYVRVAGDMQALPLADESLDGVLLAYTLGYGLPVPTFTEIARVLKPVGTLMLYDMVSTSWHTPRRVLMTLGYKCYTRPRLHAVAEAVGLHLLRDEALTTPVLHPALVGIATPLAALLKGVVPRCMVWRKGDRNGE